MNTKFVNRMKDYYKGTKGTLEFFCVDGITFFVFEFDFGLVRTVDIGCERSTKSRFPYFDYVNPNGTIADRLVLHRRATRRHAIRIIKRSKGKNKNFVSMDK